MSMPAPEIEPTGHPAEVAVIPSTTAGRLVTGFAARVFGWCLQNTSSSTAAAVSIYDGADSNGRLVFPLSLAANEVAVVWLGDRGVHFMNGVYVNVTAQGVQGSLFYRHLRGQ
jgi:hypothetical protein